MKKIVNKLKQNAKIITAFVLGAILTGGTVYAATVLPSSQVGYDNSASGLAATDVQGALDELYTRANTWIDASIDYSSSHLKINLKVKGPGDIRVFSSYLNSEYRPNEMFINGTMQSSITNVVSLENDGIYFVTLYWDNAPSKMTNLFKDCSNILVIEFEETGVASNYDHMFDGTSLLYEVYISNGWNNAGIVNALMTQTDVKPTYIN